MILFYLLPQQRSHSWCLARRYFFRLYYENNNNNNNNYYYYYYYYYYYWEKIGFYPFQKNNSAYCHLSQIN